MVLKETTQDLLSESSAITYINNIQFTTPETLGVVNRPIAGTNRNRLVSGSFNMYLREATGGDPSTAELLTNIQNDPRTKTSSNTSFTVTVGPSDGSNIQFNVPAAEFDIPTVNFDEITNIGLTFAGQEPAASVGSGGELVITATKG